MWPIVCSLIPNTGPFWLSLCLTTDILKIFDWMWLDSQAIRLLYAPNHLLFHSGHTPTHTHVPVISGCVSSAGFLNSYLNVWPQCGAWQGSLGAGDSNWFIAAEMWMTVSMRDEHSWWRLVMMIYSRGEGHTQDERSATCSVTAGNDWGSWQALHCKNE